MPFTTKPLTLLVIEDNDGDFVLFEAYLQQTNFTLQRLDRAISLGPFTETDYDIAFLDLSLPGSGGVESFIQLNRQLPQVPIVVLTGNTDGAVARECIRLGAQDYLVKDELNGKLLEKSIHFSIERKKNLEKIRNINRQYELVASVTNDIVWNWNLDTNEVQATKKDFFGYTEDTIEKSIDWWIDKVNPADKKRVVEAVESIAAGKTDYAQEEYRFRAANGEYRYVFNRVILVPVKKGSRLVVGAMMDITERKKLQEDLVNAQLDVQKQITEASLLAQEKQKEEIGKELHDNINQILASVKLYLDTALRNEGIREELVMKSMDLTVNAINEIRQLSHSLMPPSFEKLSLKEVVEELADELNAIGCFTIHVSMEDLREEHLGNQQKIMLYRIIQEQLNNIIKYANAEDVCIGIKKCASALQLTIADNGVGFDPAVKSKGIGLKNIESRVSYYAGKMHLHSTPGKGTVLEVMLPLAS